MLRCCFRELVAEQSTEQAQLFDSYLLEHLKFSAYVFSVALQFQQFKAQVGFAT